MSWAFSDDQRDALRAFLGDHGICDGPLTIQRIGDGHSNLTFLVSDGARKVVVRRPPPPPIPPGAHDMLREARLIGALSGTDVPVPEVLAIGRAGEVLDVPFYVMGHVEGVVVTERTPDALGVATARRQVGEALIDALAALHAVDWRARGLGDFGRPEGFNARHLRRMSGLIAGEDGSLPEPFADVSDWLGAHVPAESAAAIVHFDFRLGNVILGPDPPGRILAVLDWELATIADPLLDVGYFLTSYPTPGEPLTPTQEMGAATLEPGYPTRDELAERYAAITGRDLSDLRWHGTLALWKLAVLYEYGRRRAERGHGDAYYADPSMVRRFLEAARRSAGIDGPVRSRA